jgi:hypothetical protein
MRQCPLEAGTVCKLLSAAGEEFIRARRRRRPYFFFEAFFLAFFFAFAMTRSPYQVSPGPEYIHALQNYKQLIELNASVITFTSTHRMRECFDDACAQQQ